MRQFGSNLAPERNELGLPQVWDLPPIFPSFVPAAIAPPRFGSGLPRLRLQESEALCRLMPSAWRRRGAGMEKEADADRKLYGGRSDLAVRPGEASCHLGTRLA